MRRRCQGIWAHRRKWVWHVLVCRHLRPQGSRATGSATCRHLGLRVRRGAACVTDASDPGDFGDLGGRHAVMLPLLFRESSFTGTARLNHCTQGRPMFCMSVISSHRSRTRSLRCPRGMGLPVATAATGGHCRSTARASFTAWTPWTPRTSWTPWPPRPGRAQKAPGPLSVEGSACILRLRQRPVLRGLRGRFCRACGACFRGHPGHSETCRPIPHLHRCDIRIPL